LSGLSYFQRKWIPHSGILPTITMMTLISSISLIIIN